MNAMKMKILEELLSHLDDSQGGDLKSLLDQGKNPPMDPLKDDDGDDDSLDSIGKDPSDPEGLKMKSVEVIGKPKSFDDKAGGAIADISGDKSDNPLTGSSGGDSEMTDDEFEELLKKQLLK